MWTLAGLVLSVALSAAAWWRSRAPGGHYDREVYGMTPAVHRRYAALGAALAIYFASALGLPALPVVPPLAIAVVAAILYAASFVRGAEADG